MAATDKTRVAKPSPIKENEQGQLVAKKGISRDVIEELSKICLLYTSPSPRDS